MTKPAWPRLLITLISASILAAACTANGFPATPSSLPANRVPSQPPSASVTPHETTLTSTLEAAPVLSALTPTIANSPTVFPSLTPTFDRAGWEQLPVIPPVGEVVRAIYARGQELGNDPHAFSKIGDCETAASWFLGDFDAVPVQYSLGSYTYLQPVIQQFSGSFNRVSLAARIGFNAASVLNPIWSDPKQCQPDETPLACEVRLHRPSFVFILLGTNDVSHPDSFEPSMRSIIQFLLDHGIVPILTTKADNREDDYSINITIARLAYEYNIPLWNFWSAVQPLPKAGLQDDLAHLTWAPNNFDNPYDMKSGWAMRNLTALQMLNAVWNAATSPTTP